ncbi:MAG: DNRLRE domain-containing protein [Pseudomonadota bacterium]
MSRIHCSLITTLFASLLSSVAVAQTTLTLQADRDNTLYESSSGSVSNGQGPWLYFGLTSANIRRALVRFDTASIPAGSTILSAELNIQVDRQNGGATPITASTHRMLADWGEGASNAGSPGGNGAGAQTGDATWVHTFFEDQTWASLGGDFESSASASTNINGLGEFSFNSAGLVADLQAWVNSPEQNFGWMIRGAETTTRSARRMGSRENSTLAPTLEVTFQAPDVPDFSGLGTAVQGSWFNPDRGGEGFVFDFFTRGEAPNNLGLVVYFYTYDLNDRPLYLVGSIEGLTPGSTNPIVVEVIQTQGTSFGPNFNADNVAVIPWGDLEIEFFNCESAEVRWFPIAMGFGEGSTIIERLVPLSEDVSCQ